MKGPVTCMWNVGRGKWGNIAGRGKRRNRWACAEIAWRMVIEQQMRAIPLKSIADVAGE